MMNSDKQQKPVRIVDSNDNLIDLSDYITKLLDGSLLFEEFLHQIQRNGIYKEILSSNEFFENIVSANVLSFSDVELIINSIEDCNCLYRFNHNSVLLRHILLNNLYPFKLLIDKYYTMKNHVRRTSLSLLLSNTSCLEPNLFESNSSLENDLSYLIECITVYDDLESLVFNTEFLRYLLRDRPIQVYDLFDKFFKIRNKFSYPSIYLFVKDIAETRYCLSNKLLTHEDLLYIFDKVKNEQTLADIFTNRYLLSYSIKNLLFTTEIIERYNDFSRKLSYTDFFDFADKFLKKSIYNYESSLKMYKMLYNISDEYRRNELFEILRSSQKALQKFKQMYEGDELRGKSFQDLRKILFSC